MKNIIKLCLITILVAFISLVGSCGSTDGGGSSGSGSVKKTVVTYCNWNFGTEEANNLVRRKVEAFNKSSSTIRIEIVTPVETSSYDDFITTLAAAGELPDVFMVNSVPTAVINEWALDITSLVTADSEWQDVPESLRESITYNGHTYAVPAGQYYMGFFANYDLINEYLVGSETAEEKFATGEYTTEEWIAMVKAMKDLREDGTSVIGMNATGDMINWVPSTLDTTGKTGHFVWNSTTKKFEYTSQVMIDSLKLIADLADTTKQYVYSSIPTTITVQEEEQDYLAILFGASGDTAVFENGQMGFIQQGSWADAYEDVDFNYSFISYPDAKVVSASDYMCISKSTKHAEAAYEVAKYMTFGEEGINATFDIIDNNPEAGLSLTGIPLNTKQTISDKWFSYIKMNGLKETFEKVASGKIDVLVEGNKSTPGFQTARFYFNTGLSFEGVRGGATLNMSDFIWDVCSGAISVNDYISSMTQALCDRINKEVEDAYKAMGLEY